MKKIHLQCYLTPYTVSKFTGGISNLCWRGCSQVGTLGHMLWHRLNVRSFWNTVSRWFSRISSFFIRLKLMQAVLSLDVEKRGGMLWTWSEMAALTSDTSGSCILQPGGDTQSNYEKHTSECLGITIPLTPRAGHTAEPQYPIVVPDTATAAGRHVFL